MVCGLAEFANALLRLTLLLFVAANFAAEGSTAPDHGTFILGLLLAAFCALKFFGCSLFCHIPIIPHIKEKRQKV